MKTILFSGRFDRVHPGHLITIMRLGQQYDTVIVCVLDYKEQKYPLEHRMTVLKDALMHAKGNYIVISNKVHFAKVQKKDLDRMPMFTHYGAGNEEVLKHIRDLFINMGTDPQRAVWVERYPGYSASKETD